jgi:glycosyltransferase involved in cell wall biosynthesis
LRIAQLATNVERVPPAGYGGTELVTSLLTEELINRGHEVTLFATADSVTQARLVSVTDRPLRTDPDQPVGRWAAFDLRLLLKLEAMQDQFDIVHNHMGWSALSELDRLRCKSVSTNHNLINQFVADIYLAFKHLPYVAISNAYKRLNFENELNYVGVVYNGINTSSYAHLPQRKRDYLLFLGRLGRSKGTVEAIEIARRLGLPMKLAGKIDDYDYDYFDEKIKPCLGKDGIDFIGEVDLKQKTELYQGALAVVYPIDFDEPFGLVMAESLACGTPVMAFNRGSVPEVLSDGETAVIGRTVDELVSRFPEIGRITPEACVNRVRRLFDVKTMVDGYEQVYAKILQNALLPTR